MDDWMYIGYATYFCNHYSLSRALQHLDHTWACGERVGFLFLFPHESYTPQLRTTI